MNWRTLALSMIIGLLIDICLVWLFYWFNGEPFRWYGFWIWQAVLIGAGILLWLRELIGFVVWFVFFGCQEFEEKAFIQYLEYGFDPFVHEWDDVDNWIGQHITLDRSSIAAIELNTLSVIGMRSFWRGMMIRSAYKKAAIKYSVYLKRRLPTTTHP